MNNSKFVIESMTLSPDSVVDHTPKYRERESELVRIIEALRVTSRSKEWGSLKTEVFDNLSQKLRNELLDESKKAAPDTNKLNRIAGQLLWAEKYSDLDSLAESFKVELTRIRTLIHGTTSKES